MMISKDGTDIGPYGLNEARALVRSGEITLENWAWVEDSPEWVRLREVPGLLPFPPDTRPAPIRISRPTPPVPAPGTANAPLAEEEELWRGHPSQILNLGVYSAWAFLLAVTLGATVYRFEALYLFAGLAVIALIHAGYRFFQLRSIEYVVTTQRVRVIAGLFSKTIEEVELFRVKDTTAHQTLFQRLFGLGTMTILSGDERTPQLILHNIPKALELRERLRHDVMTLRQHFGVRELDVMSKNT